MAQIFQLSFRESLLKLLAAIPSWEVQIGKAPSLMNKHINEYRVLVKFKEIQPIGKEDLKKLIELTDEILFCRSGSIRTESDELDRDRYYLVFNEQSKAVLDNWYESDISKLQNPLQSEIVEFAKHLDVCKKVTNSNKVSITSEITLAKEIKIDFDKTEILLKYLEDRGCIEKKQILSGSLDSFIGFEVTIKEDLDLFLNSCEVDQESKPALTLELRNNTLIIKEHTYINKIEDGLILQEDKNGVKFSKLHPDRLPLQVIQFFIKNPNKFMGKEDIVNFYKATNEDRDIQQGLEGQTLKKVIDQIGFKNDIYKAFFEESGARLRLVNPVTKDDLKKSGIKQILINEKHILLNSPKSP